MFSITSKYFGIYRIFFHVIPVRITVPWSHQIVSPYFQGVNFTLKIPKITKKVKTSSLMKNCFIVSILWKLLLPSKYLSGENIRWFWEKLHIYSGKKPRTKAQNSRKWDQFVQTSSLKIMKILCLLHQFLYIQSMSCYKTAQKV